MPDMNIREVSPELLREFKAQAAMRGLTLRAWVLGVLMTAGVRGGASTPEAEAERLQSKPADSMKQEREAHDPKTCRVYRCAKCIEGGFRDPARGLA